MCEAHTNTVTFSVYLIMKNFCIYGKKKFPWGKKGEKTHKPGGSNVDKFHDEPLNKMWKLNQIKGSSWNRETERKARDNKWKDTSTEVLQSEQKTCNLQNLQKMFIS